MKVSKLLTLDSDIAEELSKENNASGLVNNLLKDYFISGEMEEEEIKKKFALKNIEKNKIIKEMKKLEETMDKIQKKKEHLKEIYKNIPDEIIRDFEIFPKMDEKVLNLRYLNIYKKKYKVDIGEILKAFEEFKK